MPRSNARTEPVIQPSDLEKAWAAGYMDGEGTVGIYPMRQWGRTTYALRIRVSSVQRESLDFLVARWGGTVRAKVMGEARPTFRTLYSWSLSANQAFAFLQDVYPSLVLKKPHARNGMIFQMLQPGRALRESKYTKGRKAPQALWDVRAKLCDMQRAMNKRGRVAA